MQGSEANRDETEYRGCGCGNIMMQGQCLSHCDHVHFTTDNKKLLSQIAESVFVVGARGIAITRLDKASAKMFPDSIVMKCDMCCSTFKIVIPRPEVDTSYVQFVGESVDRPRRMSVPCKMQPLSMMLPPPLKRFMAAVARQRVSESITSFIRNLSAEFAKQELFESDIPDPDTMFREESVLCVGAFSEPWTMPGTDEY